MKLEVGKSYNARSGATVRILMESPFGVYRFIGDNSRCYAENGVWLATSADDPRDLIFEVGSDPTITLEGLKFDQGKPDLSLISRELMEEVALVRMFGLTKYPRDNWKLGFKVTRSCAAALRHIFAFLSGETNDKESGCSHLAHAICCLEHALYDMKHRANVNDDRGNQ